MKQRIEWWMFPVVLVAGFIGILIFMLDAIFQPFLSDSKPYVPPPRGPIKEREDPPFDYYYTTEYLQSIGRETFRNWKVESETITPTEADWEESRRTGLLPVGFRARFTGLARVLTDDPIERQWHIDNGYTDDQGFALKPCPKEAREECRRYVESVKQQRGENERN